MDKFFEEAQIWTRTHNSRFQYKVEKSAADNELVLNVITDDREVKFTLTCSNQGHDKDGGQVIWDVCCENNNVKCFLSQVIDFCESQERSMTDILTKIDEVVTKATTEHTNVVDDDNMDYDDNGNDDGNDDEESFSGDDGFNGYYDTGDAGTVEMPPQRDSDEETLFGGIAAPLAYQRLTRDLKSMKQDAHRFCIDGSPRNDNLFLWDVKLTGFPADTPLGTDIIAWAKKFKREPVIYMEMQFPPEYPMAPPFVRVIRPRFKFLTGHVTIGGSICMEMLTKSGWTPTNDIESILVQIRSEIMSDPNTRLDANDPDRAYDEAEARQAFSRMVQRYGWQL